MTREEIIGLARSYHESGIGFVREGPGMSLPATILMVRDQGSRLAILDVTMMNNPVLKTVIGMKVRSEIKADPTIIATALSADGFRATLAPEMLDIYRKMYGQVPSSQHLADLGLISRSEGYHTSIEFRNSTESVHLVTKYRRKDDAVNDGPIVSWEEAFVDEGGRVEPGRLSGFFLDVVPNPSLTREDVRGARN